MTNQRRVLDLNPAGKVMLNLDTEDWNEIFIGCAGGGDSIIRLPVEFQEPPSNSKCLELSVTGGFLVSTIITSIPQSSVNGAL